MNFIIQTIDTEVVHDFSFELIQSLKYHDWKGGTNMNYYLFNIDEIDDMDEFYKDWIPIGTVEFVHKFINRFFPKTDLSPINVPTSLFSFSNRLIENIHIKKGKKPDLKHFKVTDKVFVKGNESVKGFEPGMYVISDLDSGWYQISTPIEILSEYRCFIHNYELVGLKHYSGDFTIFPNARKIKDIVYAYKKANPNHKTYSFDVGVNTSLSTFIIEMHHFYSLGFYGFSDYPKIPYMFKRAFENLIQS